MASTVLRVEFDASTAGLKKGAQDAIGIVRGVNSAVGALQGIAGSMLATPIVQAAEALASYRQQAREAGTELASKFSPEIIRGRIENRIREMQVGQQLAGSSGAQMAEAERRKKEQELGLVVANAGEQKTLAEKAMYGLQNPTQTLSETTMAGGAFGSAGINLLAGNVGGAVSSSYEGLFRLRRAFGFGESAQGIAAETAVLQALRNISTNTEGAR